MDETETLDVDRPADRVKPRNPVIAFFLSILTPGLGHVYDGKPEKGLLFYVILLITPALYGLTGLIYHYYGLLLILLTEIVIRVCIVIDAIRQARHGKEYILKPYNKVYYYVLIGAVIVSAGFVYNVRSVMNAETIKIPTTSLEPNALVGDYIMVRLFASETFKFNYGDLVIYNPTVKTDIYCCRIVALPGDSISVKKDNVILNGQPNSFEFIKENRPEVLVPNDPYFTDEFGETFPNGIYLHVLLQKNKPDSSRVYPYSAIRLNSHQYFLMGDNRDNAYDSRYLGPIDQTAIKGLMLYSYWGKTSDRINVDFRK
jgi:signal peptidase I